MLGIDIVKIKRIEDFIDRFGDKALQRFLTPQEILLVKSAKTAAGFWAAKEACAKALGTGIGSECSFFDMQIYKDTKGAPHLALSKKIVKQFQILDVALSITHDGEYALSVVTLQSANSSTTNKIKQF